jgi:hypothetical protein
MATCSYCGSTILFGGVKKEKYQFCNNSCFEKGKLILIADKVPEDIVKKYVSEVHGSKCPKCQDIGPVDVHNTYKVTSFLIMTSFSTKPTVSCRSCATKSQIGSAIYTLLFGWWGFPWGILLTPVYIFRNILGIVKGPDPSVPSKKLEHILKLQLAAQLLQKVSESK